MNIQASCPQDIKKNALSAGACEESVQQRPNELFLFISFTPLITNTHDN